MTSVPLNYSWQGLDTERWSLSNSPSISPPLLSASPCPSLAGPSLWRPSIQRYILTLKHYEVNNVLDAPCLSIEFLFLGKICELFWKTNGECKFQTGQRSDVLTDIYTSCSFWPHPCHLPSGIPPLKVILCGGTEVPTRHPLDFHSLTFSCSSP